jgi:hypothetical protein
MGSKHLEQYKSNMESKILVKGWQKALAKKLYEIQPNIVELNLLHEIRQFMKCRTCGLEICYLKHNGITCYYDFYSQYDTVILSPTLTLNIKSEYYYYKKTQRGSNFFSNKKPEGQYYRTIYRLVNSSSDYCFGDIIYQIKHNHVKYGFTVAKFHTQIVQVFRDMIDGKNNVIANLYDKYYDSISKSKEESIIIPSDDNNKALHRIEKIIKEIKLIK